MKGEGFITSSNLKQAESELQKEVMQVWFHSHYEDPVHSCPHDSGEAVDGAKFATTTHQSGSTRARIVLAFHAALLEVSLARGGNHPGWLLFDAPKQHELRQTDFDAYTDGLLLVAAKHPGRVQMVFSVADLKTQFQSGDEVWIPRFTVAGNPRFLGPVTPTESINR